MRKDNYTRRDLMRMLSLTMVGVSITPYISKADKTKMSRKDTIKAVHIKKGQGAKGKVGGMDLVFKLTKEQTNGHMACDEVIIRPGFLGAPPHMHKTFDEICYVTEGTIQSWLETILQLLTLETGTSDQKALYTHFGIQVISQLNL